MIHLVTTEQECFLSHRSALKACMEEGTRDMVLLLDIALFLSSICQIHISPERERTPKIT